MGSTEEKTNYLSDEEIPLKSSPVAKNVLHSFDCETAAVRSSPDTRWWKTNNIRIRPLRSAYIVLVRAKINVLLPFGPLAILLHYLTGKHVRATPLHNFTGWFSAIVNDMIGFEKKEMVKELYWVTFSWNRSS